MVWKEALEAVGSGEGLLDLFGACQVGEDGGAFDGGAAFEVVACSPGRGTVILCWGVERTEIDDGCFVSS